MTLFHRRLCFLEKSPVVKVSFCLLEGAVASSCFWREQLLPMPSQASEKSTWTGTDARLLSVLLPWLIFSKRHSHTSNSSHVSCVLLVRTILRRTFITRDTVDAHHAYRLSLLHHVEYFSRVVERFSFMIRVCAVTCWNDVPKDPH